LVVNKTGIPGLFDILLQWNVFAGRTRPEPAADAPAPPPNPNAKEGNQPDSNSLPDIFNALEQELGLKLQAQKGPVEVYVIDRVERPTEN
jgi:uncharacterized protein (TIGR03435 family)